MSDTEDLAALNDRLMAKNHALAEALSRAGKELTKAKSQLAQLAQPPLTFATMVKVDSTRTDEDGTSTRRPKSFPAPAAWWCLWPPTSTPPA